MASGVSTGEFVVSTARENELVDITDRIVKVVAGSGLSRGVATVFVVGSTAGVTTIEYEPGLVKDFPDMLDRAVPKKGVEYEHQKRWRDGNGHSHVKASLLGPSLSIPFVNGELVLGEWQQVVLVEFDIRPRTRSVIVQLVGE